MKALTLSKMFEFPICFGRKTKNMFIIDLSKHIIFIINELLVQLKMVVVLGGI